jgi:hypothetical protein
MDSNGSATGKPRLLKVSPKVLRHESPSPDPPILSPTAGEPDYTKPRERAPLVESDRVRPGPIWQTDDDSTANDAWLADQHEIENDLDSDSYDFDRSRQDGWIYDDNDPGDTSGD